MDEAPAKFFRHPSISTENCESEKRVDIAGLFARYSAARAAYLSWMHDCSSSELPLREVCFDVETDLVDAMKEAELVAAKTVSKERADLRGVFLRRQ